jgi:hypothetical protein
MDRTTKYLVEYHVIFESYFRPENSVPAQTIADIWGLLAELGSLRAEAGINYQGNAGNSCGPTELGSRQMRERIENSVDVITLVGASVARTNSARDAVRDSDVNFLYSPDEVWEGSPTWGHVGLSVSGQIFEQVSSDKILRLFRRILELLEPAKPQFALIDIAPADDGLAGTVYGTAWPARAPLHRLIEAHGWNSSALIKGDRVRGVYWGNFYGPEVLERLGGLDRFSAEFEKHARFADGSANAHSWPLNAGLLITLSMNPLDCRPDEYAPELEANLMWVLERLGRAGVLSHW